MSIAPWPRLLQRVTLNATDMQGGDDGLDPLENVAAATSSDGVDEPSSTGTASKGKKLLDEEDTGAEQDSHEESIKDSTAETSASSDTVPKAKVSSERAESPELEEPDPKPDAAFRGAEAWWVSVLVAALGAALLGGWL